MLVGGVYNAASQHLTNNYDVKCQKKMTFTAFSRCIDLKRITFTMEHHFEDLISKP